MAGITKVTHLRSITSKSPTGRLRVEFASGATTTVKDDGSFNEYLQRCGEPVLVDPTPPTPLKTGKAASWEDERMRKVARQRKKAESESQGT
jgi:hypothetical protein